MTSKTKVDVYLGILTREFDGEIMKFNIYDAMKCPSKAHFVFVIDVIELNSWDTLKAIINHSLDSQKMSRDAKKFDLHPDWAYGIV